jgi:UDP-hydrolysing UDP-N-acetyl-D-glucosamine 2-epimerase
MKVAVVTGSRADYGPLRSILAAMHEHPDFEPRILVTAMHLDSAYGDSVKEIERDGHAIAAYVPAGTPVRKPGDFARNLASATFSFSDALAACEPDLLLVLGDRFEILAAALAATDLGLPIAHIHGGELSEGSLDDAIRHCVTKLAHLHFVSTRAYAERVCQLGEDPRRVHLVGAPGIEPIGQLQLLDRDALAQTLGLRGLPTPLLALTFHPASRHPERAGMQTSAVTGAADEVLDGGGCVVVTLPNDDPGNSVVRQELRSWADARPNVHAFATLGQLRYLSLLSHADAVLGNSSSAIIEAPSFRVPVVNVGERQRGRVMATNVVSAAASQQAIATALRRALDPSFRASLAEMENPYRRDGVAERLLAIVSATPLGELGEKRFFDLPDGAWRRELKLGGSS